MVSGNESRPSESSSPSPPLVSLIPKRDNHQVTPLATEKPQPRSLSDEDEWKALEIKEQPKTWRNSVLLPIGMFAGACALAGFMVVRGRGDGRALSQRIMESRVAAQAALLCSILGVGAYFASSGQASRRSNAFDDESAPAVKNN